MRMTGPDARLRSARGSHPDLPRHRPIVPGLPVPSPLLQYLPLPAAKPFRNLHGNLHEMIAYPTRVEDGQPLPLEPQHLSGLRPLRNVQRHLPVHRFDLHLRPEDGIEDRDAERHTHVVAVAPEPLVLPHADNDEQITRLPPMRPRLPLALETHRLSVMDAGRNRHGDRPP